MDDDGGFWNACPKQFSELLRNHRTAEIEPLSLVTFVSLKKCQLFLRLDAFGNDAQFQAAAHADYRRHDSGFVGSSGDLANEGLINFEGINRKLSKIAQARVAGAEVID